MLQKTDKKENTQNVQNMDNIDDSSTANRETDYKRGKHPNSLVNLNPFHKGVSGNPSGRPFKYVALKKALDKIGAEVYDGFSHNDKTYKQLVLETIWDRARCGKWEFIKILAELGCLDD